jgi:hypothetical protein
LEKEKADALEMAEKAHEEGKAQKIKPARPSIILFFLLFFLVRTFTR